MNKYFYLGSLLISVNLQAHITVYSDTIANHKLTLLDQNSRANGEFNLIESIVKNNDTVFDVGACIGQWASHVATFCSANIYTFEPVLSNYTQLVQKYPHFNNYNYALSDTVGTRDFYFHPTAFEGGNFFNRPFLYQALGKPVILKVKTETIDDFCRANGIQNIDYLKIDTEGSEYLVLRGAEHLLNNHKVRYLQFEYGGTFPDAKITLKQIYEFLYSKGYKLYRIVPQGIVNIDYWRDELEDYKYANFFATVEAISK